MRFLRKNFYLLSLIALLSLASFIVLFREEEPPVPPLKDRTMGISMSAEWMNTKQAIEGLIYKIRKNPDDLRSKIQLAQAYIQEARITGDYNYYDLAAMKLLKEVLEKEPGDYEGQCALATIYLSQHHFKEGLDMGLKLKKEYWHEAWPYGILTDAYVELGQYDDAVRMADSMCGIRPDLKSYSRISYLREIHGYIEGAKDVMKKAINAGVTGSEQTEWCRVYLGRLYEQTGDIDTAELVYKGANMARPNYAYALAGLGRVERAKKNYDEAIKYFVQAQGLVKDYSFGDELIDLYQITGQKEKADSTANAVLELLNEHANTNDEDQDAGHYADKELAYVYLKMSQNDLALQHAAAEYKRRPDNIEVNELMAWVHYKRGDFATAVPFAEKALRTGCKNPELLCRMGLVYCQNNQAEKGRALLSEAIHENPFLAEELLAEGRQYVPDTSALSAGKF